MHLLPWNLFQYVLSGLISGIGLGMAFMNLVNLHYQKKRVEHQQKYDEKMDESMRGLTTSWYVGGWEDAKSGLFDSWQEAIKHVVTVGERKKWEELQQRYTQEETNGTTSN